MLSLVITAGTLVSCNSCSRGEGDTPAVELCVQDIMESDYDYIASQYNDFHFYEVDIHFNQTIDSMTAYVDAVRTIFQIDDTCIMFDHSADTTDTLYYKDNWLECMDLNPRVPVTFDSCMTLVAGNRCDLHTQYVTFRRPVCREYVENGWWIFGAGLYAIDSYTGEPVMGVDDTVFVNKNLSIGMPIGEWPLK